MSETTTEQNQPQLGSNTEAPEDIGDRDTRTATPDLHDAPGDADDATATGYAVFNRTIGQYVPGVHRDKPSKADAAKAVPEGHTAAVVRV